MADDRERDQREDELHALEDLVTSEGFTILRANCAREWNSEAFTAKVEQASRLIGNDGHLGVREMFAGRDAVRLMLEWPYQRIAALKQVLQAAQAPPRGAGRM